MTARFIPDGYPGGGILLQSGSVNVGAVLQKLGKGPHRCPWVWRFWGTPGTTTRDGGAKTELAAKTALLSEWRDFLRAAALAELADPAETPTHEATE